MAGQGSGEGRDPFGVTARERLWRRLAGAGLVVIVATAAFGLLVASALPFVLFGAGVVYLLGVPASWMIRRRRPGHGSWSMVWRHGTVGGLLGVVAAGVLTLVGGEGDWLLAWLLYAVPAGLVAGGMAAGAGLALPGGWVRPVAAVGLTVTVVALPAAIWWQQRPPAPHDFVQMNATDEVREAFGDAEGLAAVIADGFEREAAAGRSRTAHGTWVTVADDLADRDLGDSQAWFRFTPDDALPRLRATGEPGRLITTIVAERDRACVVVTGRRTDLYPHECRALDLTL